MTAPARPVERLKRIVEAMTGAGLKIAAAEVLADGTIRVQTVDDPRVAKAEPNPWDR